MFKEYMKYLASEPAVLNDYVDLKKLGLTKEEIEGYFDFFENNKECALHEHK